MTPAEDVRMWFQNKLRVPLAIVSAILAFVSGAQAAEKASEQVSPFYGSFGYSIPIEVPPFHGLEPRLALAYNSEGRNGMLGAGWTLAGFSTIERANSGRGTPRFDGDDIYLLDGQELVACVVGSASPSCTSGGTHSTKIESYLKIRHDTTPNDTWTVWGRDGTRTVFTPKITVTAGIFRWGQTSVVDTKNNTVTYTWNCTGGDCYPLAVQYNGYQVYVFLEPRPDSQSAAAYSSLIQTQYRVRSILVWLPGVSNIRAYKLSYATSALTGRSLLASVQQYGKDVTFDAGGTGLVTGGTSLPASMFTYQADSLGKSFVSEAANPPSPPNTLENVVWANVVNAAAVAPGNSLQKSFASKNAWDAGASSTRAIASGDGYVEVTATADAEKAVGLSNGDTDTSYADIDFAIYESFGNLYILENTLMFGPFGTVASGDRLRVEVQGGVVRYKKSGVTFYTSTKTPVYPLLVDAAIQTSDALINSAVLSGSLQDANYWCQGARLLTGDFNKDGRTDQLCARFSLGGTNPLQVALATATGFLSPTTWLASTPGLSRPLIGDFNGDGRADIVDGPDWNGDMYVSLSTGTSFTPFALWGNASGTGFNEAGRPISGACKAAGTIPGVGDFNGDGFTDVSCRVAGDGKIFIGLSNGSTGFSFSIFANLACEVYEQTGAIDFDGDGKDDWFCIGMTNSKLLVFPSTGSKFVWPAFGSLDDTFCDQTWYVFGDFNGDGRTDAACISRGNIALSTGHAFVVQGSYGGWCNLSPNAFAADVDGDGASEIVCEVGADIQVRKWKGQTAGLGPVETWKSGWCADSHANAASLRAGDFNGDGKTDLLCTSQTTVGLAGTGGLQADLLSLVDNGLRGTVQVTYGPATNHPNTNVAKQVVATVTTNDGLAAPATTTYNYSDGFMEPKERRFLGFHFVQETPPCLPGESPCPYTVTALRQDLPSAGKMERLDRWAGTTLLARKLFDYTTSLPGAFPATSLLTSEWSYSYVGASEKHTYTTHRYDAYGNRTQTSMHGDAAAPGDETTLAWTYRGNPTVYIVDRIARQEQFVGIDTTGTKLAEQQFYYDNANTWDAAPSQGYPTASLRWLDTEARLVRRNMGYDAFGNLASVTDEDGRLTTTQYDTGTHVFPTVVTNGANEVDQTDWDPVCGVPARHTDANTQVTTTTYDNLCRPKLTTAPLGVFESRFYVNFGLPDQHIRVETPSTSAINLYRKQYFDGFGRVYRTAVKGPDANDNVQDTTYNARGLVASQSMPSMETSPCDGLRKPACPISFAYAYAYDGLNRLTATRFPDGHGTTQSYPLWGQTTTDEHGHTTTVQLDAYGNRVWLRQNQGVSAIFTRYTYDLLGRMVGMTDHLSNAWSWTFDSLGRNTQKTDPDAGTWGFTYYDSGLMHTQLDAKGQTTSFTYDNAGRLATKANVADTVTITRGELRGTYSNVGRVTTIRAGVGVTPVRSLALDYDARGRAVRQTRTMDTGETYVASKVYASGGYLQSITYPDGDTVGAMGYDAAGRLYSIPGIVNSIQYDAAGRATLQANFNGTTTTRAYSPRGFLTAIATTGSTQSAIQNLVYTPDPAGLVTQVTSPFPNESWTYDYDNLHRLTAATGDNSQTFQYDEIGRITFNSRVGTYTYPSPGIPGSPAHAPDHVASQIISYDANGNTTSGRKGSVTWNADNVPSQINGTWFMYDGLGERLRKVTGSSTSIYPLGDDYEITNGVVTKYISVDGLGVIAKRVGTSPNITTYWLHTDRLGSVQAVTDANNGVLVQRRTYLPYGDKIADTTAHAESRGWIDQRTDGETRLTYLHARYYDPELGLFLSPDPLHPAEPGVGLNRYSYGLADPINGSDENGLEWTPVCGVADDRWECSWLWVPDPREPYGDGEDPIDPTRPGWDRGDDPGQNPTDPGNVIPPIIVPPPCAPNCELPGVDGGTVVDIVAAATGIEDVIKLLAPNSTRQQRLQALATIGVMVVTDGLGSLFTKAAATTALGRSIRSLTSSLETGSGSWLRLSAHAETAAGRAYRGGTSIEEVFINPATGERLVRHTIVRDGNILHQTFRPDAKFGGE